MEWEKKRCHKCGGEWFDAGTGDCPYCNENNDNVSEYEVLNEEPVNPKSSVMKRLANWKKKINWGYVFMVFALSMIIWGFSMILSSFPGGGIDFDMGRSFLRHGKFSKYFRPHPRIKVLEAPRIDITPPGPNQLVRPVCPDSLERVQKPDTIPQRKEQSK